MPKYINRFSVKKVANVSKPQEISDDSNLIHRKSKKLLEKTTPYPQRYQSQNKLIK
jgi:hypothetical protein